MRMQPSPPGMQFPAGAMMSRMDRRHFVTSLTALGASRAMGANDRIAVAAIGCGRRGLLKEALEFARETNVEITAVCDTWRRSASRPRRR